MTPEELSATIEAVKILKLHDDDILVFKTPHSVSKTIAEQIHLMIQKTLGREIKILVLDGGSDLEIIRKEK